MPATPAKAPSTSLASLLALVWTLVRRVMKAMKDPNCDDSLLDKLLTEAEVLMRRRFWEHVCRTNNREDRLSATDAEIAAIWYETFGGPMPAGYTPRLRPAQAQAPEQRKGRRRARMTRPKHVWVAYNERRRKARPAGRAALRIPTTTASAAIRAPP